MSISLKNEKTQDETQDELLNKYFRFKSKYEENQFKKQKKTSDSGETKKSVNLCVKCKKPGGTLFSLKKNTYTALCKAVPPCDLQMKIYRGYNNYSWDLLYKYREILEDSKNTIQILKNNIEFQYVTDNETIRSKFQEENTHYEATLKLFDELFAELYDLNREEKRKEKTRQVLIILNEMNDLLNECKLKTTGSINDIIEKQIVNLIPMMEELRQVKYQIMEMENIELIHGHSNNQHCQTSSSSRDNFSKYNQSFLFQGDFFEKKIK
jgi:hypothetical protein